MLRGTAGFPMTGGTSRQRAWRIEMSAVVNADSQAIDEFSTQPPGNGPQEQRSQLQEEQVHGWRGAR